MKDTHWQSRESLYFFMLRFETSFEYISSSLWLSLSSTTLWQLQSHNFLSSISLFFCVVRVHCTAIKAYIHKKGYFIIFSLSQTMSPKSWYFAFFFGLRKIFHSPYHSQWFQKIFPAVLSKISTQSLCHFFCRKSLKQCLGLKKALPLPPLKADRNCFGNNAINV